MKQLKKITVFTVMAGMAAFSGVTNAAAPDDLPVNRIILSTSGLAQIEHSPRVSSGNSTLTFPVRLDQVDDVLKSLVVFDSKGHVGGVTLPGKQPLDQIFKDLPFTRQQLTSSMFLFNAYQGAEVLIKHPSGSYSGKIVQVVPETVSIDEERTTTKHRLSVMSVDGLKQILLEEVQSIQFMDEKVRVEIAKALDAVRENSTTGRRMLSVNLVGKEDRPVTLSYVVPTPLWKTAYRMVVPEAGKTQGFLQGWAVIENMTASDWKNVDLSLVSGSPVTFRQALYQSYYVARPEIPVQVFGLSLPRVDEGTISSAADMEEVQDASYMPHEKKMKASRGVAQLSALAAPAPQSAYAEMAAPSMMAAQESMDSVAGSTNAAQGTEAATQVLYHFPNRVNLSVGQSMMLPFVSRAVQMERLSLYQPETNAKHPLAAVEIENDSDTGLPSGVLTLYQENADLKGVDFSGDAQLPVIAPGERRMISYALDTKTTIDRNDSQGVTEAGISAAGGVLKTTLKNRNVTVYAIKAPVHESRVVMIEQPRIGDYKIVDPDPRTVEVTDKHYRIRVPVAGGQTKLLRVAMEQEAMQSYNIIDMGTEELAAYATSRGEMKSSTRKQFHELATLRRALNDADQKVAEVEQQRQAIFEDQARVRENLKSLSVASDVQQKYLDKLNTQEDQVAALDQRKQVLLADRQEKQSALQDKIASLTF